ncbi:MAG: hypothetical protein ABI882_14185 [Acidobacteriota bacterium]
MGPQVKGNPDIFTVRGGRIYIFGSQPCHDLFEAAPEKYLEPAATEISASADALKSGRSLIEKATVAMGGATRIDALTTYHETALVTSKTAQGEPQSRIQAMKSFPDRLRREQVRPFGTIIEVITPATSFAAFQNQTQNQMRDLPLPARADLEKQLRRSPLEVLRARRQGDFKAALIGSAKVGEASIDEVDVSFSGLRFVLGIEGGNRPHPAARLYRPPAIQRRSRRDVQCVLGFSNRRGFDSSIQEQRRFQRRFRLTAGLYHRIRRHQQQTGSFAFFLKDPGSNARK